MTGILSAPLDWTFKGLPAAEHEVALDDIAERKWNVLAEDVMLPVAVLRESALAHNLDWMRRFCELTGVEICPHGKTTMAPQLFDRQLAAGAWGITAATVPQLRVYRKHGIGRVLLANQLIGRQNIAYVLQELERDPQFDFYCLVDSPAGVDMLDAALAAAGSSRPVQVLIELGMEAGRAGVRRNAEAIRLAEHIARTSRLKLRGFEAFEGIVPPGPLVTDELRVSQFVQRIFHVAESCGEKGLLDGQVLLTAGGSAFFDIVARVLTANKPEQQLKVILRSGCYLTHDNGTYHEQFGRLLGRSPAARELGTGFEPAIELWAYILSRPEPGRVIAGLGKRDASFDADLPRPLTWSRPRSGKVRPLASDHRTVRLDDQHAYLDVPAKSPLQVGDMISFGISHPCTTFDRWPVFYVVDDARNIIGAVRTYF